MSKQASLHVQKWGNSLAVRMPTAISRAAKLTVGLPVEITLTDEGILIKPVGEPKLSLHQKLASFDPEKHITFEVAQ